MRAAELFEAGFKPAQVAEQLEASVQAASVWFQRWQAAGSQALAGAGRAGRRPRLSREAMLRVEKALQQGALAQGYRNELWTLSRIAEVIKRETGVSYHPGHVWRLLQQLGWSRQKPSRRALERDPEKIANWLQERWPEVKKGP
jgi:transposase